MEVELVGCMFPAIYSIRILNSCLEETCLTRGPHRCLISLIGPFKATSWVASRKRGKENRDISLLLPDLVHFFLSFSFLLFLSPISFVPLPTLLLSPSPFSLPLSHTPTFFPPFHLPFPLPLFPSSILSCFFISLLSSSNNDNDIHWRRESETN